MNILMSANKAFFEPSKVMLHSLIKHNTWEKISIYLLHHELEEGQVYALKKLVQDTGNELHEIRVNEKELEDVPVAALSKETYYRLFAVQLLPKGIDRILYLDVDILVTGSLQELYEANLEQYYFAAAKDTSNGVGQCKKQLEIPERYTYVNAGVLLMNMRLLRNSLDVHQALDFARRHPRKVPNCDQDVINALFYDKIKIVSSRFNQEARYHSIEDILFYPWEYLCSIVLRRVKLIHYMGAGKPWKKGYNGKFGRLYYRNIQDKNMKKSCRGNYRKNLCHAVDYLIGTGSF